MKQKVIIEWGKDGSYSAYAPDMQNAPIGTGNTAEETKQDFLNTVREMREVYMEEGKTVPEELNAEFNFQYDISALFSAFPFLNISKTAHALGINESLMRQYSKGQYVSKQRTLEIEAGIHELGARLQKVSLTH